MERIPDRAVRWAGFVCWGSGAAEVLTVRIWEEIWGVRVAKTRWLARRRMLASLDGERMSSGERRIAKPREETELVCSWGDETRERRAERMLVVDGARRRMSALESQKIALIRLVLRFWASVPGGKRLEKMSAARPRSGLETNLLTRREKWRRKAS